MFDVNFIESGSEPQCSPDPRFPNGKRISLATEFEKSCTRNLPYPAPRCGVYKVTCRTCGYIAAFSVTGRTDDPNMVSLPCKTGGTTT